VALALSWGCFSQVAAPTNLAFIGSDGDAVAWVARLLFLPFGVLMLLVGVRQLALALLRWVVHLGDDAFVFRGPMQTSRVPYAEVVLISDREGQHGLPRVMDNFWIEVDGGRRVQVSHIFEGPTLAELQAELVRRVDAIS